MNDSHAPIFPRPNKKGDKNYHPPPPPKKKKYIFALFYLPLGLRATLSFAYFAKMKLKVPIPKSNRQVSDMRTSGETKSWDEISFVNLILLQPIFNFYCGCRLYT